MPQASTPVVQSLAYAVASILPFMLAYTRMRRNLWLRRAEIARRLSIPQDSDRWWPILSFAKLPFRRQAAGAPPAQEVIDAPMSEAVLRYKTAYAQAEPLREFDAYYAGVNYVAPLGLCVATAFLLWLAVLAKYGMADPANLGEVVAKLPAHALAGAVGGYVWGLSDLVDRARNNDLAPSAFAAMWVRMPLAAIIAPAVTPIAADNLQFGLALVVGAFPVSTMLRFFTSKVPLLKESAVPDDPATLQLIQGMSERVQRRLDEEGIERVQHLAYKDPVKLIIRCNMDWEVLTDFIDQALLVQYIGKEIESFRPTGVRGAIEMAEVTMRLDSPHSDAATRARATATIAKLATILGTTPDSVLNIGHVLKVDPVVAFLWDQWTNSGRTGQAPLA